MSNNTSQLTKIIILRQNNVLNILQRLAMIMGHSEMFWTIVERILFTGM